MTIQTCCPGCGVTLQNKQQEEEMPETKQEFIPTLEWVLNDIKNMNKENKIKQLCWLLEYYEKAAEGHPDYPVKAGMSKKETEKVADSAYDAIMQITNGRHYDNFI